MNHLEDAKLSYAKIAMNFWNGLKSNLQENDRIHFVLTLEANSKADPKVEPGVLIILGKFTDLRKKEITINTIKRHFDERSPNARIPCEVHQTSATFDVSHLNEMHLAIIKKKEGCFSLGEVHTQHFPWLIDCIEHETSRPVFRGEYHNETPLPQHPYFTLPRKSGKGDRRHCHR